jgi:hypothetical protein
MDDQDREWMRTLDSRLWVTQPYEQYFGTHKHTGEWTLPVDSERLTADELRRLVEVLREGLACGRLAFIMENSNFGFRIAMEVVSVPPPLYPGVIGEIEHLLLVDQSHVPRCTTDPSDAGCYPKEPAERWSLAWQTFHPFTHHPDNAVLLARLGLPLPRDRESYEY